MTGSEVVMRDHTEVVRRFLSVATDQPPLDPRDAMLDMITRVLAAESPEDVLEGSAAVHAEDVLGDVLTIVGVRWNESDIADGMGFYALIDCTNADGDPFVVTCGSVMVMAQLFRLNELGALPGRFVIEQAAKATRSGYKPMSLRGAPEPF